MAYPTDPDVTGAVMQYGHGLFGSRSEAGAYHCLRVVCPFVIIHPYLSLMCVVLISDVMCQVTATCRRRRTATVW